MINIVVDMMGGDDSYKITVPSVEKFANENKDVNLYCIGTPTHLTKLTGLGLPNLFIIPSKTVVKMDADPMSALKDVDSSLMVGIKTLIDNDYDAIVSAGSTGALLSASVFKIKRISGIKRPALTTSLPTTKGDKKTVVLDLGANTECSAIELEQFATLGSIYYSIVYQENRPSVAQLNIGTEEEKGTAVNKEVYTSLKNNKNINFVGNIESREVLNGLADVVICDGYSGNIFLKSTEGAIKAMSTLLKAAFKKNLFSKLSYLGVRKSIGEMKEKMNYKSVGGAILLGVNKVVVKAHGSSDEKAFYSALKLTKTLVVNNIVEKIKEEISK